MAINPRTGQVTLSERAASTTARQIRRGDPRRLAVDAPIYPGAARFADQHGLGLRASDKLHFAAAREHGDTVHTIDRLLAAAGPVPGVSLKVLS